jgi:hypothetical protein
MSSSRGEAERIEPAIHFDPSRLADASRKFGKPMRFHLGSRIALRASGMTNYFFEIGVLKLRHAKIAFAWNGRPPKKRRSIGQTA